MPRYDWDAIKSQVDIVSVIGASVSLKKRGNLHEGCCPFHADKTPSFKVYEEDYHCFGCGAHGDVVDFVMETQRCDHAEAIERIAGGGFRVDDGILKDRARKQEKDHGKAIMTARARWQNSDDADEDHPYLVRKQVPAHMARQEGGNLLLPVYDAEGKIQSVQTIAADGGKMFARGAPMKAGRLNIGIFMGRVFLCEGYATGAAIYEATADQVCVAFSKGNMAVLAHEFSAAGVSFVIAADNNALEEMRALELAPVVAPPAPYDDFNDQAVDLGYDAVSLSIIDGIKSWKKPAPKKEGLPFDLSGVDLTDPPGFVGEVAQWIEAQSFRPRRHLAVAGALTAIGNIAGLRYIDDLSGVTTNLFAFCVAGARTGKEAVQQAMIQIHRTAGFAPCSHGGIKSEQEVTRNLVRHQAALYVVDEFGIFLAKVRNAQKKGGAAYLDGVIGILMSAYSKANSWLLLTGDAKEEVRSQLMKELSQFIRKQDELPTPYNERRIAAIETMLASLDNGLDRPFLSLMGFTTPVTFEGLIDHETATNGFIGRSLIFNEKETAPRHKKDFSASPMTEGMANMLRAIACDGEYDVVSNGRVENYGERTKVPTEQAAIGALEAVSEWMEGKAEAAKETGLESLYLGAYELVSKVSLILAVAEQKRTVEHVRWAFALVRRDIEEKINLVIGNDQRSHRKEDALTARIVGMIPDDGGEIKESIIVNRCQNSNFRKDDVLRALAALVKSSSIEIIEKTHPTNGKSFFSYKIS